MSTTSTEIAAKESVVRLMKGESQDRMKVLCLHPAAHYGRLTVPSVDELTQGSKRSARGSNSARIAFPIQIARYNLPRPPTGSLAERTAVRRRESGELAARSGNDMRCGSLLA